MRSKHAQKKRGPFFLKGILASVFCSAALYGVPAYAQDDNDGNSAPLPPATATASFPADEFKQTVDLSTDMGLIHLDGPILRSFLKREDRLIQDPDNIKLFDDFISTLSQYAASDPRTKAEAVNKAVNAKLSSRPDVFEYWSTPVESLKKSAGDCEDHAFLKYYTLRAMGVPAESLYVALVDTGTEKRMPGANHAVLLMKLAPDDEKSFVILDNRASATLTKACDSPYIFYIAINEKGSWPIAPVSDKVVSSSVPFQAQP